MVTLHSNCSDELISIEHKFLRVVSRMTPMPMLFFNHGYTAIREYLRLPSLRNFYFRNDYIISFKITKRLFNSSKINEFFTERSISYNFGNPRPLTSQDSSTLNYINFSLSSRLGQLWNLFSREIGALPSLAVFKNKISE